MFHVGNLFWSLAAFVDRFDEMGDFYNAGVLADPSLESKRTLSHQQHDTPRGGRGSRVLS